ncbi:phosphoglycerate kinase, partial [Candidatus Bipolaricaulota bacterium]
GGGETGEAAVRFGFDTGVSFISTGGGACLALLRGKPLPALDVLFAA